MENMELDLFQTGLPETLEDLTRFILIGKEKLAVVTAEIRVIEKLDLAYEVRKQKQEEYRMLSEVLLEAEIRIGELLSKIPKKSGRPRQNATVEQVLFDNPEKTKTEIVQEMGLTKDEARNCEMLARNKDMVDQLKQEASANNRELSKTELLHRISQEEKEKREKKVTTPGTQEKQKQGSREEEERCDAEFRVEVYRDYNSALSGIESLKMDDQHMQALRECIKNPLSLAYEQGRVRRLSAKLDQLQDFLDSLEI